MKMIRKDVYLDCMCLHQQRANGAEPIFHVAVIPIFTIVKLNSPAS